MGLYVNGNSIGGDGRPAGAQPGVTALVAGFLVLALGGAAYLAKLKPSSERIA